MFTFKIQNPVEKIRLYFTHQIDPGDNNQLCYRSEDIRRSIESLDSVLLAYDDVTPPGTYEEMPYPSDTMSTVSKCDTLYDDSIPPSSVRSSDTTTVNPDPGHDDTYDDSITPSVRSSDMSSVTPDLGRGDINGMIVIIVIFI